MSTSLRYFSCLWLGLRSSGPPTPFRQGRCCSSPVCSPPYPFTPVYSESLLCCYCCYFLSTLSTLFKGFWFPSPPFPSLRFSLRQRYHYCSHNYCAEIGTYSVIHIPRPHEGPPSWPPFERTISVKGRQQLSSTKFRSNHGI